jgi:hypothetical protein
MLMTFKVSDVMTDVIKFMSPLLEVLGVTIAR